MHVDLPTGARPYKRTPVFTEKTVPTGLLKDHKTRSGVWGLIQVEEGKLRYSVIGRSVEQLLTPGTVGVVHPEEPHHVAPVGTVRFFVEFWR